MPVSVTAHNSMLDHLGSLAGYAGLCQGTTLASGVTAGATSVDLDNIVEVDDLISLNDGGREERKVTAVSGTGPYTATLDSATTYSHATGTYVGHAPKAATGLREVGGTNYARQSITWNAAASENLDSSNAPSFEVGSGSIVGGFLLSDVADPATATFYGAFLTGSIQYFSSAGLCDLTDGDVTLTS